MLVKVWEYMSIEPPWALPDPESVATWELGLNNLGKEGWEFFKHEYSRWWFKRYVDREV